MTKLTTKKRNELPDSKFSLPSERKYPVDTKNRARNALARVAQQENKGNISASAADKVKAKARKVLKKGKK